MVFNRQLEISQKRFCENVVVGFQIVSVLYMVIFIIKVFFTADSEMIAQAPFKSKLLYEK